MAAFGVALWKYTMRYAPHSPDWFNRDRFILSNGQERYLRHRIKR
jgi:dihydroxyacetone synthase